jgi:hypothetical protein
VATTGTGVGEDEHGATISFYRLGMSRTAIPMASTARPGEVYIDGDGWSLSMLGFRIGEELDEEREMEVVDAFYRLSGVCWRSASAATTAGRGPSRRGVDLLRAQWRRRRRRSPPHVYLQ